MAVCDPKGELFRLAESTPSSPALRFVSVYECPVIKSAIESNITLAPQGSNHGPNAKLGWAFKRTAEYKTLRFAMQSFPSKSFLCSSLHRCIYSTFQDHLMRYLLEKHLLTSSEGWTDVLKAATL